MSLSLLLKRSLLVTGFFLSLSPLSLAQPAQALSTDQLRYYRFMLMNVASTDHSPDAVASYEASLVQLFGLNSQESAVIHSAGQQLKALLLQLRASSNSMVAGRSPLTPADSQAIAALVTQRERMLATLAGQLSASLRPAVAAQIAGAAS